MFRVLLLFPLIALLAACAGANPPDPSLPRGNAAYGMFPASQQGVAPVDYKIGPLDSLDISVFQEPDLSAKGVQVDASGNVELPLIGTVAVSGKTAPQLSRELETRYGQKYLEKPQVTVIVSGSVSQKVVVQGEVTEPGVYEIKGPTTLLEAIAMAKGETQIAKLNEVVVFRTVNGQRLGAVFDVAAIRRGEVSDPQIQGNDMIVVGYSAARNFWHNVISAAPLFNIFRPVTGY